ncbi:MAG: phosphoribosylglycinamide formyltransferase, partial [Actinomycetota bacterium]
VLVSGTGSLLQAILDGQDDTYEVAVVASDRKGVLALERAEEAGVPTVVVAFPKDEPREVASEKIARALRDHDIGLAVSAGFMKILTADYFDVLGVPAMNSHPALLPSFPGAHGVRDALAHGVKVTGTTIHFATPDVDAGPIIFQEAVAVVPDDTEATLHERIKEVEQRLYPEAIRLFAMGRLKVEGRRVHILPAPG